MQLKLVHKIMLLVSGALAVSIVFIAVVATVKCEQQLLGIARSSLEPITGMALHACALSEAQDKRQAQAGIEALQGRFDALSKGQVTADKGQLTLDVGGAAVPMGNDTTLVDGLGKATGAEYAVYVTQESKAVPLTTTVRGKDGARALGEALPDSVYKTVIRDGRPCAGFALVAGRSMVLNCVPLHDVGGKVVGSLVCAVPIRSESLRSALLSQQVGKTGYVYTMNTDGVLQVHPAKEGVDISSNDFIKEMKAKGPHLAKGEIAWVQYPWLNKELGETEPRDKIVAYTYFPEWGWIVACGSYLDEFTSAVVQMRNMIMVLGVVSMIISLAIGWYATSKMMRPIKRLVGVAEAVSQGDVNVQVDISSQDEVGVLARGFEQMVGYMKGLAGAAERIAANDLTVEVAAHGDKDVLGHSFRTMVSNLTKMVQQLGLNAIELVSAANEIASSAEQMSRGAQDQAQQMGQVSTAVEEISATIMESSRNASDASEGARGAATTATNGGQIVSETIQGMQRIATVVRQSADSISKLATSADQIGRIIGVIDDIADQTNLLALNAAIEAARAGEQGRGFAVVADEVRKLAERTGKATSEITEMIKGIQHETQEAVTSMEAGIGEVDKGRELADRAGASLSEVVTGAQRVMDMIAQIANAAGQQSAAAEEISKNIEAVTAITQETAKGVQESAKAADELNRQAESIQKMVAEFKVK